MLRRSPLTLIALSLTTGIILALYLPVNAHLSLLFVIISFCLSLVIIWISGNSWISWFLIWIFFAALGFYSAGFNLARNVRWQVKQLADSTNAVSVYGQAAYPAESGFLSYRIRLHNAVLIGPGKKINLRPLEIWIYADSVSLSDLRYGDFVAVEGRLVSASETAMTGRGTFIPSLTQKSAGRLYVDTDKLVTKKSGRFHPRRSVDAVRDYIKSTFNDLLDANGSALCTALILGDRSGFGKRFTENLRVTGLTHLFALSGLNTGFLLSLFWVLFGLFLIPHRFRYWLLLLLVLFYMELGREAPSLVRASLMCSCFLVGRILHRRAELLNYIAAAACIELILRPLDLLDAGFLLSYLSVLGILFGYWFIRQSIISLLSDRGLNWRTAIVDIIAGTVSAQIATWPVVIFLFHRAPLLGIIGNILAIPGFAILLIWAALLLLIECSLPWLSPIIAYAINVLSLCLGYVVDFFAALPMSSWSLHDLSLTTFVAVCSVMLIILIGCIRRRLILILAAVLILGNYLVWSPVVLNRARAAEISFIDVGNGDAILVSSEDDKHILIDTGPRYGQWTAAERINRLLTETSVPKLDAVVLTHVDLDHIGGCAELMKRLPIDRIFVNGDSASSYTYQELQLAVFDAGIPVTQLRAGQTVGLSPDCEMTVLHPDSDYMVGNQTSNLKSIVFMLRCGGSTALLTADIDSTVEHQLLSWGDVLDADLLKVAHHGSGASTTSGFLKEVSPAVAVITCGRRNPHGHPSPEVIHRLEASGASIYSTAQSGTVSFHQKEGGWKYVKSATAVLAHRWSLPYG